MWRLVALMALVTVGCSSLPGTAASGSRTSSPSAPESAAPSPAAHTTTTFAVLVDLFAGADTYDLAIVSSDGSVVARAHPHKRTPIEHALELPYVSTSNSGVYYLDGDREIHYLKPDGTTQVFGLLPNEATIRAAFAVMPDDSGMAVALLNYGVRPVSNTMYVRAKGINGALTDHIIYSSTTRYFWPVGWHAGNLVVAYLGPSGTPFDSTERYGRGLAADFPYGPNPYGGINVHVINPKTAVRLVIMSGGGASGLLSKAGTAVVQGGGVAWSGRTIEWSSPHDYGSYSTPGSLSPDGDIIAACCVGPATSGSLALWYPGDTYKAMPVAGTGTDWVGWFDDSLLITGFYHASDGTPAVVDINTGVVRVVDAHGIVAAMLPGGLG